jgi:voltage-gated potassium channel
LLGTIIWIIFILISRLKFTLAPDKTDYLKANWLTALALIVPALRVFRIFRVFEFCGRRGRCAACDFSRFDIAQSRNEIFGREFRAARLRLRRRFSVIVVFAGAAGMLAFENEVEGGIKTYGDALWWTAMMITTIGSEYFPQTAEGRVLCFILALYGFAVFGYVTATLATFSSGATRKTRIRKSSARKTSTLCAAKSPGSRTAASFAKRRIRRKAASSPAGRMSCWWLTATAKNCRALLQ